jgi:hypothetical protein
MEKEGTVLDATLDVSVTSTLDEVWKAARCQGMNIFFSICIRNLCVCSRVLGAARWPCGLNIFLFWFIY